ncbi:MAG: hypothetical protein ABIL58_00790 [Pseudomonadota bacterium]
MNPVLISLPEPEIKIKVGPVSFFPSMTSCTHLASKWPFDDHLGTPRLKKNGIPCLTAVRKIEEAYAFSIP